MVPHREVSMPESQTYGTVGACPQRGYPIGSKVIEQDVYQLVDSLLWVQKVASSSLAILRLTAIN